MILFIENPKEPIKLLLELKNKFSKVAGVKKLNSTSTYLQLTIQKWVKNVFTIASKY